MNKLENSCLPPPGWPQETPNFYQKYIHPGITYFDSETCHHLASEALHFAGLTPATRKVLEHFAYSGQRFADPRLHTSLGSLELENPLMVGAGWDKEGRAMAGLHVLGFSSIEVGSVLLFDQPGNDRPRQWLLSLEGAALNNRGLNSPGVEVVRKNLEQSRDLGIPIGLNIGMNNDTLPANIPSNYAVTTERIWDYAAYLAINAFCPNTHGLHLINDNGLLPAIIEAVKQTNFAKAQAEGVPPKDIYLKISPDLIVLNNLGQYDFSKLDEILQVGVDAGITGFIDVNTTTNPKIKAKYRVADRKGGLSGNDEDYRTLVLETILHTYQYLGGRSASQSIIASGSIWDTRTAILASLMGAKAFQVVTAMRHVGLTVPGRINTGLVSWMEQQGIDSLEQIRGEWPQT